MDKINRPVIPVGMVKRERLNTEGYPKKYSVSFKFYQGGETGWIKQKHCDIIVEGEYKEVEVPYMEAHRMYNKLEKGDELFEDWSEEDEDEGNPADADSNLD